MLPVTAAGGCREQPTAGVAPLLAAAGQYAELPAGAVLLAGLAPAGDFPTHLCMSCCISRQALMGATLFKTKASSKHAVLM